MKTILCYGDSNTWGYPALEERLPVMPRMAQRWGSVMRQILGDGYGVIEEGLSGRTTVWDDPVEGEYRNGKPYLLPCLRSHMPLDLVIIMLGTNDLKSRFNLTPYDIASGAGTLVDIVLGSDTGPNGHAPQVLLVCPAPLGRLTRFADMFAGGAEKSRELAPFYRQAAHERGCAFLDAGQIITTSDLDGIHFEPSEQEKLGRAIADVARRLLT